MRARALTLSALLSCAPLCLQAQSFTGTYQFKVPTGGVLTLSLKQDAAGHATGSLSGNGSNFPIDAKIKNKNLVGKAGEVYFEAALEGDEVEVVLADIAANGQPDFQNAKQLIFERQAGVAAAPVAPSATARGNPLGGSSGNPLGGRGGADPMLGTFLNEQIAFTVIKGQATAYAGNMEIGGQDYPFMATGSGGRIAGSFKAGGQTYQFHATLAANTLTLVSDNQTYTLQRRGAAEATAPAATQPGAAAQPATDAQSQQLTRLLMSSNWCTFSYNATSGRSSSSKSTYRPDGSVVTASNSEGGTTNSMGGTSVAGGSYYSQQQGGGQAQWKVQGGQLYLNFGQGFVLVPLQFSQNSNGSVIAKANGVEYSQCQ